MPLFLETNVRVRRRDRRCWSISTFVLGFTYVCIRFFLRRRLRFPSEKTGISFGKNKIMSEHNGDCLRSGGQILPFFDRFCLECVFLKWPVLINNDMEKLFLSFVLIFVFCRIWSGLWKCAYWRKDKKHMPLTRRSSRIKGHALFLIIWQNAEKDDGKKGKHGQKRS